jgi:hypothetical protein
VRANNRVITGSQRRVTIQTTSGRLTCFPRISINQSDNITHRAELNRLEFISGPGNARIILRSQPTSSTNDVVPRLMRLRQSWPQVTNSVTTVVERTESQELEVPPPLVRRVGRVLPTLRRNIVPLVEDLASEEDDSPKRASVDGIPSKHPFLLLIQFFLFPAKRLRCR